MHDFDVFLSYHWRDHAAVEALARRLLDAGLKVFLDRWYLTPGTNWLRELESKLARCRAVAVCTGAEMGPWQQREAHAALDRQAAAERTHAPSFPVIPVLLPGAEAPLGFLGQNTWVDLREGTDDPLRLEPIGRLDLMEGINERVNAYYEQLGDAGSPDVQRRRAVALHNQGDTLFAQGQLEAARKAYEQFLAIIERLAWTGASNAEWQRDLSVSYNKLGDVEVAAGRLDAARKAYEQSLVIRERLARSDASNAGWQRDLSLSYERLGNVLAKEGRPVQALEQFAKAEAVLRRLAAQDPSNATWKNDLAHVQARIAELRGAAKGR